MARATTTPAASSAGESNSRSQGRGGLKGLQAQLNAFLRKGERKPTDNPYKRKGLRGLRAYLTWGNLPVFLACFLLLLGIGVLLFLAMGLYADIGRSLASDQATINWHFLGANQVKDWWVIGWPLALLLRLLAWLLYLLRLTTWGLFFVAIFLLLQAAEVAHCIFYNSPRLLRYAIEAFSRHQKYTIPDSDSRVMARLKERHNHYYEGFYEALELARNVAYAIDFFICFTFVPITKDGRRIWETFGDISFDWSDINAFAVFRIAISLFIIHLLVKITLQISKGFKIFARAESV